MCLNTCVGIHTHSSQERVISALLYPSLPIPLRRGIYLHKPGPCVFSARLEESDPIDLLVPRL